MDKKEYVTNILYNKIHKNMYFVVMNYLRIFYLYVIFLWYQRKMTRKKLRPELRSHIICNVQPERINSECIKHSSNKIRFDTTSLTMMAHYVKVGIKNLWFGA